MAWDHKYRRLSEGEIIRPTDECMRDSPFGWDRDDFRCAGEKAPDPNYTPHRTYRRLKEADEPERHKNPARNLVLNRCVSDLDDIINNHDPEIDVPIKQGVWDRLDKLALDIADAAVLAEREQCAQLVSDMLGRTTTSIVAAIRARATQEGK